MRGKKREKIFKNTRFGYPKIFGKKSSGESAKTRFFYKNTNIVAKKSGKKHDNFFFRNIRISRAKNDGKKSSRKSAKTLFFLHSNIETKKSGKKNA